MTSDATGPKEPQTDEPQTEDPSAGLSATGRTADQLQVDGAKPGTDYGAVSGVGDDDQESAAGGSEATDEPRA